MPIEVRTLSPRPPSAECGGRKKKSVRVNPATAASSPGPSPPYQAAISVASVKNANGMRFSSVPCRP